MIRVSISDLSRLPVETLAQLLMEWAITDNSLLARLHATIAEREAVSTVSASTDDAGELIDASPAIQQISEMIERFARTEEPVLITGESGTGKELAARAIHRRSRRSDGPFVAVNCAALPSTLVASELFGYEKGAFTGAAARTKGQIEHAQGGTLFLDEIGDMPIDMQGHLLRFLQERQIVRVGGRETIDVDVRVVAATNVRLLQAIGEGRFREDLYYRLNLLTVMLPPLRERPEDISVLAHHFLGQAATQFGRDVTDLAPETLAALLHHDWPGNVRELMSVIRRAVVVGNGTTILPADLIGLETPSARPAPSYAPPPPRWQPGTAEERMALLEVLKRTQENITLTAQDLGVSRVTLYRMLRRHAIVLNRGLKSPPIQN